MPLQAVEPQRLYRQIAEQLRSLLVKGEYAVGARLPAERDLARQLGVSRPSVREALIALEVGAWVEVRTGSGVYVLDRSGRQAANEPLGGAEWGPLELIRARRLVEGETAAIAAQLAKRKDMDAMQKGIDCMVEEAAAGVVPQDGDRAFHSAIVEAGGNGVLVETVMNFYDARRGPIFTRLGGHFENAKSWQAAINEHKAILAAIRAHDAPAARAAMHAHLDQSHRRFSASWRRTKRP
jgi:DNA-binding FadR family transcriptional regulator